MRETNKLKLPETLRERVLAGVKQEERRRARVYLAVSGFATLLSLTGIVLAGFYTVQGLYQSSFYEYLSLALSDTDVVLTYWKEFTLSLVESAPFLGITASLIACGALFASVRVFANHMRVAMRPALSNI